jgi:hypothetical protein
MPPPAEPTVEPTATEPTVEAPAAEAPAAAERHGWRRHDDRPCHRGKAEQFGLHDTDPL